MKKIFFYGLLLLGMLACSDSNVAPAPGQYGSEINRKTGFFTDINLPTERGNTISEKIYFTETGRYFLSRSWNGTENYESKAPSPEGLKFKVVLLDNEKELKSFTSELKPSYSSTTASVVFNIQRRHLNKSLTLTISASLPESSDRVGTLNIGIYWYRPRLLQ